MAAEADRGDFVEPGLDLALEFRFVADRTRLLVRPSGRHVLADAEPVCQTAAPRPSTPPTTTAIINKQQQQQQRRRQRRQRQRQRQHQHKQGDSDSQRPTPPDVIRRSGRYKNAIPSSIDRVVPSVIGKVSYRRFCADRGRLCIDRPSVGPQTPARRPTPGQTNGR